MTDMDKRISWEKQIRNDMEIEKKQEGVETREKSDHFRMLIVALDYQSEMFTVNRCEKD
jgi:hypothetical protein